MRPLVRETLKENCDAWIIFPFVHLRVALRHEISARRQGKGKTMLGNSISGVIFDLDGTLADASRYSSGIERSTARHRADAVASAGRHQHDR